MFFDELPVNVRKRIYEFVVRDHDRELVFFPRALPRKVTPETDADVKHAKIDYGDGNDVTEALVWPDHHESGLAAGRWVDGEGHLDTDASKAETNEAWETTDDTEDEGEVNRLDIREPLDGVEGLTQSTKSAEQGVATFPDAEEMTEAQQTQILDDADSISTCGGEDENGECHCKYHPGSDDEEEYEVETDTESEPVDGCAEHIVFRGECSKCAEEYTKYEDEEDPFPDEEEDDDEHKDLHELVGMLYEPREPAILLVNKEIREQCLPVYYATNAFSWRFHWVDYNRSQLKFSNWVTYVGNNNTKFITKISFEGRHMIEEGVEFSVDIDVLDRSPFFSLEVSCHDRPDRATKRIKYSLDKELAYTLWMWSNRGRNSFSMSLVRLKELGREFVSAMRRYVTNNISRSSNADKSIVIR